MITSRGTLGSRLDEALRAAKKSQKWLGQQLGVSQSAVSEWVRGVSFPGVDKLAQVPELLECNGHYLLTGMGQIELPSETPDLERVRRQARAEALGDAGRAIEALALTGGPTTDAIVGAAKATSRALRKQAEEAAKKGKDQKAG